MLPPRGLRRLRNKLGNVRRGASRGVWVTGAVCMTLLMLSVLDPRRGPAQGLWSQPEYRRFWRPSTPLMMDRYPGKFLPFLVFPAMEEQMTEGNILAESIPDQQVLQQVTPRPLHHTPTATQFTYFLRPSPPTRLHTLEKGSAWTQWGPTLATVGDYFRYLRTAQASCRKLVKLGGSYCMGELVVNGMDLDGHKYVCMDPAFELVGAKGSQDCLTLSFGTADDTTFDEAVSDLPCEVHMFDIINYDPELAKESDHVFFHAEGLSDKQRSEFYLGPNKTIRMDTLQDIVLKNHLFPRPIHVLKVDIENEEWQVFRDIAQNPLFDAVGQVALEVHVTDLVYPKQAPRERWLALLQKRYDVFRMIEARGFRRVVYWENTRAPNRLQDEDGTKYESAGELLYINTNWYNTSFKQRLAADGFKFRQMD